MSLQLKVFIVVVLLLIAVLLVVVDKLQSKVDYSKLSSYTNLSEFKMKAKEPTSDQIDKIVQKIENKTAQKEATPKSDTPSSNQYVPSSSEEQQSEEDLAKKMDIKEEIYQVQKGDTFYSISKRFYGTSKYANELFSYNKSIVSSPHALKVGLKIKVPDIKLFEKKQQITKK